MATQDTTRTVTRPSADPREIEKKLIGGSTYRSLGEQVLSPAEERFEKARRTVGLFLAPIVTVVFFFLPLEMEPAQQTLAARRCGVPPPTHPPRTARRRTRRPRMLGAARKQLRSRLFLG